jgi:hypothetical protein
MVDMGTAIDQASAAARKRQEQQKLEQSRNPVSQSYYNPYYDPTNREAMRTSVVSALAPGVTETVGKVTSGISPFQTGRRSASLMREAYNPMQRAIGEMEVGMEEKGAAFAGELPFRERQMEQSKIGQQQQYDLARAGLTGRLGTEDTLAGKEYQTGEREQQQLDSFAAQFGYRSMAEMMAGLAAGQPLGRPKWGTV